VERIPIKATNNASCGVAKVNRVATTVSAHRLDFSRLLLVVIVLIIHGSFYPWHFEFKALSPGPLQIMLGGWPTKLDRFVVKDIIINVFIYIPLGMLAFLALKQRGARWFSIFGSLMLGVTLSTSVEIMQLYIPTRDSSVFDIVTNATGTAVGITLGAIFRKILFRVLSGANAIEAFHPAGSLLLICCWLGYQVFPIFPVLSPWRVAQKLNDLFLAAPFPALGVLLAAAEWLAVASLLESVFGTSVTRKILPSLLFLIPAKLLIIQRTFTVPELVGSTLAVTTWCLVLHRFPFKVAIAAVTLGLAIVLTGLSPFEFRSAPAHFFWIPFQASLEAEWQRSLLILLKKTFWYGAMIWLIYKSTGRIVTATVATVIMLAAIEMMQVYIPGHIAEITDPLLALLMGLSLQRLSLRELRAADIARERSCTRLQLA
jgi:VanZ family protein